MARRIVKGYHDIVGDGGSRVLEQVAEQRTRITDGLARGAPSRGRGLRQGGGRQEHLDAASRGRSARPGASDCDPGRGLQRPVPGAHGRCPGGAVRSRQPQGRAPANHERDRGLLAGFDDPGVGVARVRERVARRVPYVARHEGVRSPRRDPRGLRVGSARIC